MLKFVLVKMCPLIRSLSTVEPCMCHSFVGTYVTFGVFIYSLAGLLIPIRLWVCLQVSVISSWRRMLGERELCVLPSGERVVWEVSLEWAIGEDTRLGYMC